MHAVTLAGWSWRTALGAGVSARAALLEGRSALVAPPPPLAPYGVGAVAPIAGEPAPSPHARYLHRVALFGLEAAREVMEATVPPPGDRFGVFTALGGLRALWDDLTVAMAGQHADATTPWARGLGKVHPYWMLRHLSNNAHALLAIDLGARGEGATFAGATGGAQAVAAAARTLHAGRLDAALVLAVDTLLQPEILLEGAVSGRFATVGPGEAAVAVLLTRDGPGPRVVVEAGIGPVGPSEPRSSLAGSPAPIALTGLGDTGAAAALVHLVALAGLGPGTWIADSGGAPGLRARVQVVQPAA